jgi:hypothetical protein
MTKLPIPNDWDDAKWHCVSIQWPDSTLWDAVLLGWLSLPKRHELWEGLPGDVLAAQEIGWDIWLKNGLLPPCAPAVPAPEPEIIYIPAGGGSDESEDDMGQVVTDVTLNTAGQIVVWFGPCCSKVLDIPLVKPEITPPYEGQDPAPTYSACGKASALVDLLYEAVDRIWETKADPPNEWVGDIEDYFPGNDDLDDNFIIGSYLANIFYDETFGDYIDLVQEDQKQSLKCQWLKIMTADSSGVTREQYDRMHAVLDVIYGLPEAYIFGQAMEIFGPHDMSNIAMLMSTDVAANCDCPEVPVPEAPLTWPDYGWFHLVNFAAWSTQPTWFSDGGQGDWLASVGLVSIDTTNNRDVWPVVNPEVDGGTLRRVAFKLKLLAGGTNWDDNSIGTAAGELVGQSTFPAPSPYAITEVWWETVCDVALTTASAIYMTLYGGATGLPDGYYAVTQIALAGSGTDPLPSLNI